MVKKIVVEGAMAGNVQLVGAAIAVTQSGIPAPYGVKGFNLIAPDDGLLTDAHQKESASDVEAPQAALAPSDSPLTISEAPMMLAMADGGIHAGSAYTESLAHAGEAFGAGAAGAEAAGEAGWLGAGGLALLGGVAGVGGLMIFENGKNTHDSYIPPAEKPSESIVHVVVDAEGAFIDVNGDGIHDTGETTAAVFAAHGNADLGANSVIVHFNDAPYAVGPVDLTGFTMNDKIEIDAASFNTGTGINHVSTLSAPASVGVGLLMNNSTSAFLVAFQAITLSSGLSAQHINPGLYYAYITGSKSTYLSSLAHWDDANNPLNHLSNVLPGAHTSTGGKVIGLSSAVNELNLGSGHGVLIDFLWPDPAVHVIEQGGSYYIDSDQNGVLSSMEQYCAPPAEFTAGGNAELANHAVTIHFHDVPIDNPLNLAGFGADDRIQLDVVAIKYGSTTTTIGSQAIASQSYGPLIGGKTGVFTISALPNAVFTKSGGMLQFGGAVSTGGGSHYFESMSNSGGGVLATNITAALIGPAPLIHQVDFLQSIVPN